MPAQESDIIIRPMTAADIPFGIRLKTAAGWNQTATDWELILENAPDGCFVAEYGGTAVGTVSAVPYGLELIWIGMLLVDSAFRRRGIGRRLLAAALSTSGGGAGLDATPMGLRLYERAGFRETGRLIRMQHGEVTVPDIPARRDVAVCRPIRSADMDAILSYDASVFGAPRGPVLAGIRETAPEQALIIDGDSAPAGFCLARPGSGHIQIGPVLADTDTIASALVHACLHNIPGAAVLMDVPADKTAMLDRLRGWGFRQSREFIRMTINEPRSVARSPALFAGGGPELG